MKKAFTLLELLTVLVLISVLAGLSVPAISMAVRASRKAEAAAFLSCLRTAVVQYQAEYGDWPEAVADFTNGDGDIVLGFDAGANQWGELYRCLSGYSNGDAGYTAGNGSLNNERGLLFMEFSSEDLSVNTAAPYAGGETDPDNVRNVIDPWRRPYRLVLDANGDHIVTVPDLDSSSSDTIALSSAAALWSTGSDPDNPRQFVATWK